MIYAPVNINTSQMNKAECSQKMDELIILLASGSGSAADQLELNRLYKEYANKFSCPYQFSSERMRTLKPDARRYVKKVEVVVNRFINKTLKKQHSRKIDEFITKCAFGLECDEAELVQLAIEHAQFRSQYKWSYGDLEPAEREAVMQMEARVNEIIAQTIRREGPMIAMGRVAMERFSKQPLPNPRPILKACKCTGSIQSPLCRLHPALCKTDTHTLARTVPRASLSPKAASLSPKAASPKTRKSNGGKRKSNSSSRKRKSSY